LTQLLNFIDKKKRIVYNKTKRRRVKMIIWVMIILVMGIFLSFAPQFITAYNLSRHIGMIITLICVGIGIRMAYLGRKGEKESFLKKIKELKEKIEELKRR